MCLCRCVFVRVRVCLLMSVHAGTAQETALLDAHSLEDLMKLLLGNTPL